VAFLAVRGFLFNIRRNTAEVELEVSLWNTGIGIADLYWVIERDNKAIKKQIEFQCAARKHEWFQQPPIVAPEIPANTLSVKLPYDQLRGKKRLQNQCQKQFGNSTQPRFGGKAV
jgi:hypothetical protein